jgi:hypothetical protein
VLTLVKVTPHHKIESLNRSSVNRF